MGFRSQMNNDCFIKNELFSFCQNSLQCLAFKVLKKQTIVQIVSIVVILCSLTSLSERTPFLWNEFLSLKPLS